LKSANLEVGVFVAPRARLREKGVGHVKGFGPQLHAKCGTVDGKHYWTGSLNLTSNSETFYEVVTIARDHPDQARDLDVVLSRWWTHCRVVLLPGALKKRNAEQQGPADASLT